MRHEIEIPTRPDVGYTYEGLATKNIYKLIVKTSLGEQFLRSFPHQFVAVTKQSLSLPFEEQPWFFGDISEEEAKSVLCGRIWFNFQRDLDLEIQLLDL